MRLRQSVLEISKSAFEHNINQIQKIVGNVQIMPVIKANAYGTYINKNLEMINKFQIVAVAVVDEAVEIRKLGYDKEIFVLNQPYKEDIENILKYDVTVGVASKEFLEELGKRKDKVRIHFELETGMGRTGININNLQEYIDLVNKYTNIKVEGIYTHFAVADTDKEFTEKQIGIFNKGVDIIENKIDGIKYIHCSASNGILNFPGLKCNLVRAGIIMYGYPASFNTLKKIDLKPVAKLKSKISFVKEVEEGTSISYGRTFITNEKSKIATVGIGYADGIRRDLSNKGEVVINNKKAPIIGKVCMDSFMVDVTKINDVKISDEVYIWNNTDITLEEVAEKCNTINYEIISTISDRVIRKFVD